MNKSTIVALVSAFLLTVCSVLFAYHLHAQHSLGHFYAGVSGGNATVRLSSYYLGDAPIKDYTLPAGWYEFQLHTDTYDYSLPIRLAADTATVVDWYAGDTIETSSGSIYELAPIAGERALLTLVTIPTASIITLDDQDTIFTTLEQYAVSPGEHTLTVSLPGYDTQTVPITLSPGYELKVTIKLAQNH